MLMHEKNMCDPHNICMFSENKDEITINMSKSLDPGLTGRSDMGPNSLQSLSAECLFSDLKKQGYFK